MPDATRSDSCHRATDLRRRRLGLVHLYYDQERADAQTSNEAARRRLCSFGFRSDLHDDASAEDEAL